MTLPETEPAQPAPSRKINTWKWIVAITALAGFCAITAVGLLGAIAIPAFTKYVKQKKSAEAITNMGTLVVKTELFCRTNGNLPHGAGPIPGKPLARKQNVNFSDGLGFREVGFDPDPGVYFSYAIVSGTGDSSVMLLAQGDLDGDGSRSRFWTTCERRGCDCEPLQPTNEFE